jgi:hypothetical protein
MKNGQLTIIRKTTMSKEGEVRNASKQLYAALNRMLNGDAGPLADIWSHGSSVTTMHPFGHKIFCISTILSDRSVSFLYF